MYSKLSPDNKYTIVKIQGDIEEGNNREILENVFLEALKNRTPFLVLDLENVTEVRSALLAKILNFYRETRLSNSKMGLLGVSAPIKEKLNKLFINKILAYYDNESDIDYKEV